MKNLGDIRVYLYDPSIMDRGGFPISSEYGSLAEWRRAKRKWLEDAMRDGFDVEVLSVEEFESRYNWEMVSESHILIVDTNED